MSLYIGEDKIGKVIVGAQSSDGGINTDDATLTSGAQMLSPYSSYSKGVKYTGTIQTRTDSNMTVSGNTVTAAAGYYANATSKSVPTVELATPSINVSASGLITATETQSAGYVAAGTTTNTQQLTTQAAQTIHPSTSDQTIASGRYLTGTQTVKAVTVSGLNASNIKSGVVVKIGDSTDDDCVTSVTGTYEGSGGTGGTTYTVTPRLHGAPTGYSGIEEDSWFEYGENSYYGAVTVDAGDTARFYIFRDNYNIQSIRLSGNSIYWSGETDLFTHDGSLYYYDISNIQQSYDLDIYFSPGSATTPATTITANPTISVSAAGLITAIASASQSITPTVSEGYVSSGTAGTVSVSGSSTHQLTARDSSDLTISGATVTAPAGYYGSAATKTVASGTAGTPTATKGTVSNHAITVTPSVTNTTGYITGGTINGTGVSVSASELVSGNRAITANGTGIDVTNYATVSVDVASSGTQCIVWIRLTGSPTGYSGIEEDTWFEYNGNSYYGAVAVDSGDTVRFCIYRDSHNIESIQVPGTTIYSSGSTDLFTYDDGYYYYDISNVQYDSAVDIYYFSGSATTPATTITANPSISVNSSTGLITATASANQNVTPTVSAGYVDSGTAGAITVSGSNTSQLTTKAAATYNTSTTDQTISAGQYLTGAQTIKAVTVSGLSASSILSGVTVKVGDANDDDRIASVTGTVVIQHYYTGSSAPSASTGSDGDIYLQTGA